MIKEDCIHFYLRPWRIILLSSCALKDVKFKNEFFIKYQSYILKHGCNGCADYKTEADIKKEVEKINAPKE